MKRAFVIVNGLLASALVSKDTRDLLNLGDRLSLSSPLDWGRGAQIEAGERGTIEHKCCSTGAVDLRMDRTHQGLSEWGNCITLEPYGTEDILAGGVSRVIPVHSWVPTAVAAGLAFIIGAIGVAPHASALVSDAVVYIITGGPL